MEDKEHIEPSHCYRCGGPADPYLCTECQQEEDAYFEQDAYLSAETVEAGASEKLTIDALIKMYPNLSALTDGRASGSIVEWPMIRSEALDALNHIKALSGMVNANRERLLEDALRELCIAVGYLPKYGPPSPDRSAEVNEAWMKGLEALSAVPDPIPGDEQMKKDHKHWEDTVVMPPILDDKDYVPVPVEWLEQLSNDDLCHFLRKKYKTMVAARGGDV